MPLKRTGILLTSKLQIPYKLKDFADSGPKSTESLLMLAANTGTAESCLGNAFIFPFEATKHYAEASPPPASCWELM